MTGCTATLTTATLEPCPHDLTPGYIVPNTHYDLCVKAGGWFAIDPPNGWAQVSVTTIACDSDAVNPIVCFTDRDGNRCHGNLASGVQWTDDAPGALPHVPPLVTDAEVDVACELIQLDVTGPATASRRSVRAALEAAAKVRQEGTS